MIASVKTCGLSGASAILTDVEAVRLSGLPAFEVVGLPNATVRESRERVRAALTEIGFTLPASRLTINLSPADVKKEGASYDLPIAIAVMRACGKLSGQAEDALSRCALVGEISLSGELLPTRGLLPMMIAALEGGVREAVVPAVSAREAACLEGLTIYPARTLREVVAHLTGETRIPPQAQRAYEEARAETCPLGEMALVRGQRLAKRALEVAAAGGHNLLLIGPPGSGKTMLARCLPGILPEMTFEEALETTRIHSLAGTLPAGAGLLVERPFRAPHHSASLAAIVGGGSVARPGELSLAHNGVIFLDEMPEFQRAVLEGMRQPLEDGEVTVERANAKERYPTRAMLLCSMNPCPCGYFGSRSRACKCSPTDVKRYLGRVSGPLLDRIDLRVEMDAVPIEALSGQPDGETSAVVRARVAAARAVQVARFRGEGIQCNARMTQGMIDRYCALDAETESLLLSAVERMGMTARGYTRVKKVARTAADLRGAEQIERRDVMSALQLRQSGEKYWG